MSRRSTKIPAKDGAQQLWNGFQSLLFYCNKDQIKLQPTELCSDLEGLFYELTDIISFLQFAEWCLAYGTHGCRIPDRPYSLFEGTWQKQKKTYSTRSFKTYLDILHYRNHMLWIHIMAFVVLICLRWKKKKKKNPITLYPRQPSRQDLSLNCPEGNTGPSSQIEEV